MMSCKVFGVLYRFVNWPKMVCGIAVVFRLMGFWRFRVVWRAVS